MINCEYTLANYDFTSKMFVKQGASTTTKQTYFCSKLTVNS